MDSVPNASQLSEVVCAPSNVYQVIWPLKRRYASSGVSTNSVVVLYLRQLAERPLRNELLFHFKVLACLRVIVRLQWLVVEETLLLLGHHQRVNDVLLVNVGRLALGLVFGQARVAGWLLEGDLPGQIVLIHFVLLQVFLFMSPWFFLGSRPPAKRLSVAARSLTNEK